MFEEPEMEEELGERHQRLPLWFPMALITFIVDEIVHIWNLEILNGAFFMFVHF